MNSSARTLQYAISEITEIASGLVSIFIRCAMKFAQLISFIHLVHMGCQLVILTGVLESNFSK